MSSAALALLVAATVFYGLRGVAAVLALVRRRGGPPAGRLALALALACHTAFVALRAANAGGLPVGSRLESVAFFLWLTAVVFAASARPYKIGGIAPVFWPCFAAGMGAMWLLAGRETGEPSSFARLWLALHLVPVYVGYASFALAGGAGATYLVQERLLRGKAAGALWRRLPSLEMLERVGRVALSFGYPPLTLGLAAGVLWAVHTSSPLGVRWYADPKVVGGATVWLFYTAVLHLRLFLALRGRRAAVVTLVGFVLTLVSFGTAHLYAGGGRGAGPGDATGPRAEARP